MAEYTINKFTYNNNTYKLKDAVSGYGSATNWLNGTGTGSVYTIVAYNPTSNYSVAEGYNTYAEGDYSHAEGQITHANGNYSHAEGYHTYAIGECSHAEGDYTYAIGECSHAEGDYTEARGNYSHAEGYKTDANGNYSHAEGYNTYANYDYQTVIGKYNNNNSANAFEIGRGTETSNQNIFQVGTNGTVSFYNPQNTLAITSVTILTDYSIAKGGTYSSSYTVKAVDHKPGFQPIGIVGYYTSGDISTYSNISDLYPTITTDNNQQLIVNYTIRNLHTSSAMSLTFKVHILWVKMI